MPEKLDSLNALFKRGLAVSLTAFVALFTAELAQIAASGAFSELTGLQSAKLVAYALGAWAFLAAICAVLENLALALVVRLASLGGRAILADLAALGAVIALLCPLARLPYPLTESAPIAALAVASPLLGAIAIILARKSWRRPKPAGLPFASVLFFVSLPAAALVAFLLDRHLVVERLFVPRHFSLAASYFAALVGSGIGLTILVAAAWYWKALGEIPRRHRLARRLVVPGLAVAVALAVLIAAVNRLYLAGLYPEFHTFLKLGLFASTQLAVTLAVELARTSPRLGAPLARLARGARIPAAALGALAACCAVYVMIALDNASAVSSALFTRSYATPTVLEAERRLFDLDRDRFSVAFGGGDCDELDGYVNPGAPEIPDNGIDDNCFGGDLTAVKIAAREEALRESREATTAWWEAHPANPKRRFNVLLVTIDTVRADHMGFGGYDRKTTPNLDAFAAKSTVFENAYCQGGWTSIAVPSIVKGIAPSRILFTNVYEDAHVRLWFPGEQPPGEPMLQLFTVPALDENPALAQILKGAGYHTISLLNDDFTDYFQPRFGYSRGFDVDYSNNTQKVLENPDAKRNPITAKPVTERAIAELDLQRPDVPFFMWVHHFNPHAPHKDSRWNTWGTRQLDRYDGEIAFTDHYVGQLLGALETRGLLSSTVVVITGDHGEAFSEHGVDYHGTGVYEEQIHVPLIVYVPGAPPKVVRSNAAHVDVVPTILDLVGVRAPLAFDGVSLVRAMFGPEEEDTRPIYSATWRSDLQGRRNLDLRALLVGRKKLVYDKLSPRYELYDLAADPGERVNLASDDPALFARMREILFGLLEMDDLGSPSKPLPSR